MDLQKYPIAETWSLIFRQGFEFSQFFCCCPVWLCALNFGLNIMYCFFVFFNRSDIFVFLLSTRAGGLGINLTAADTVWNPCNKSLIEKCKIVLFSFRLFSMIVIGTLPLISRLWIVLIVSDKPSRHLKIIWFIIYIYIYDNLPIFLVFSI